MTEAALIIYLLGVGYALFFVGLPILFAGSDCDHAFLILLPYCVVLPFVWPLVLLWVIIMKGADRA